MRIYYHLSQYISHRLSGLEYMDCLRGLGHTLLSDPAELPLADVVIIHDEPLNYPALFAKYSCLRDVRTIGYCVWENERLTEPFREPMGLVQEIWTPSEFSRQSMLPYFSAVHVVPHIVRRHKCLREDLDFAETVLGGEQGAYRFFSIVDTINPRKNLK